MQFNSQTDFTRDKFVIKKKKNKTQQIKNWMCFVCIHQKLVLATAYSKYW